ncbi:hypothetical protein PRIPAC_79846 [Pristionchus pacificus]|uniref:NR LBD domain-containing protein n=1 Tax=Pristionchus pacificus TaxID=54126 RepID=A0A2A6C203_PRIPA|nr:hypothetical protein PRIPAC_79846 [Pristionchus pacificus]|eukprot:PDM72195.1 hypothetical protein PRIPAC_38629 [Pristionchus pacificus]
MEASNSNSKKYLAPIQFRHAMDAKRFPDDLQSIMECINHVYLMESVRRCVEKGMNSQCIVSMGAPMHPILPIDSPIERSKYSPLPADAISLQELLKGHSNLSNDYREIAKFPVELSTSKNMMSDEMWPHADLVFTIEYAKTFQFFRNMSDDEKASFLSTFLSDLSSRQVNSCRILAQVINIASFHLLRDTYFISSPNKMEYHHEGIKRICELEMDKREYVLLKAIIMCNPGFELTRQKYQCIDFISPDEERKYTGAHFELIVGLGTLNISSILCIYQLAIARFAYAKRAAFPTVCVWSKTVDV